MKRFLILLILMVFVTVSCAGPNKVGGTKPTFKNEFEKDRWECIQSIDSYYDSESFGKAIKECLAKKGYKYQEDKVSRWKKSDFRQDEFEKDRGDCIQSVENDPEQMMTVEECLAKKGYELKPVPSSSEITVGKVIAFIIILPLIAAGFLLMGLLGGH